MNYLGVDVISLLDETLPHKFGGAPTDYQVVETEQDGIPRVTLHVHPQVGPVDEQALRNTIYEALAALPGGALDIEFWRQAGTLEVRREPPILTSDAKVLPLHQRA
jgi:hypothetical protein